MTTLPAHAAVERREAMAPKKKATAAMLKPKFVRSELEALTRKDLQALGHAMRERGEEVGSLGGRTDEIIESLLLIQIVDEPKTSSQVPAIEDGNQADKEIDELEAKLRELKATRKATASASLPGSQSLVKLVPPSKLVEPIDAASYRCWSREFAQWKKLYSDVYSEAALLQNVLLCLQSETKSRVFAETPAGELTLSGVEKHLEKQYAGDSLLESRQALAKVRALKRGKMSLREFLVHWEHVRATASVHGVLPKQAGDADAWDLLDASDLTNSQKGSILAEMQTRRDLSAMSGKEFNPCECVFTLLRNLSMAFEASAGGEQRSEKGKSRQAAMLAQYASAPEDLEAARTGAEVEHWAFWGKKGAKGKGKGKKGKGKQDKTTMTCYKCGKVGHIGTNCWTALWSQKGQKGQKGSKGDSKGGAKGAQDWKCQCGASVWAAKDKCYKCGTARP